MGQEPQTGVVTQKLILGTLPEYGHLDGIVECEDANDAVTVITSRGTALLPPGAWDIAEEVLREFGAEDIEIEERIHFAKFGWSLHPV
jgi:hypothetical protein